MKSFIRKALTYNLFLIYLFALGGVLYKFTLYHDLPVAAGEAYGVGDIIDLMFALVVVTLWLTSIVFSLTHCLFSFKINKWLSLKMFLLSTSALLGYLYIN